MIVILVFAILFGFLGLFLIVEYEDIAPAFACLILSVLLLVYAGYADRKTFPGKNTTPLLEYVHDTVTVHDTIYIPGTAMLHKDLHGIKLDKFISYIDSSVLYSDSMHMMLMRLYKGPYHIDNVTQMSFDYYLTRSWSYVNKAAIIR